MENNLCECGHEKKEHTKHGCLFKHTFFHEHCPCKKFKPQNQSHENLNTPMKVTKGSKDALRGLKIGGKVMPKEFFNPKFIQEKEIKMEEVNLRTLKDLINDGKIDGGSEDNLKEEAIKWVKFHLAIKNKNKMNEWINYGKALGIGEFSNITEEDLK